MPCYKLSHNSVAYFSPFLRQTILGLSSSELDLAGLISHVSHFWEKATQSMLFSSRRGKDKRSSHCRQLQNPLLESHLLKHYWPKQGIWPSPALVLELTILTLLTLRAWYAGSLLPRHSPPSFIFSLPYSPSEEKKKKGTGHMWLYSLPLGSLFGVLCLPFSIFLVILLALRSQGLLSRDSSIVYFFCQCS